MDERTSLQHVITTLERYRGLLGTAVVESAVKPLQQYIGSDSVIPAERRIVTVLFADLSGFTALAARLDPEETRDLINACFTALMAPIERYGGTIDKFIGDEIMVLFGAPHAHEDDPERAVRTALELQATLRRFNEAHATELGLHIGINTGLVVAGGIGAAGRYEYTVIGDAVNVAARLVDLAERDAVLLGPDTYRAVAPLIEAHEQAPVHVKGKAEPVLAYRLNGLAAQPGPTRGISGLHAPLIGRDAELQQLHQALDEVLDGRGQIVLLVGEAGLGKSRLIRETRTKALSSGFNWIDCRGIAYDSQRPYSLFQQLLRQSFGIPEHADVGTVRAQVGAQLKDRANLSPIARAVIEMVLTAHSSESDSQLNAELFRRQLQRLMLSWWREQASQAPLALIFDDLHWADAASATLMQQLFALVPQVPVLFLCATRPDWELLPLAAAQSYAERYTEIQLQPLTEQDSNALVDTLLYVSDLPADLRSTLLHKSEGIPFFVEEVVRELIDSGAIMRDSTTQRWRTVNTLATIELPDNLQSLLMARIDRLPPSTRRTLQQAAVMGRAFSAQVLSHLTPSNGVQQHLQRLEDAALILPLHQQPDEYVFRHALTQEAAYASILVQERRVLHAQVGTALETLFPQRREELAPQLAQHFANAGDSARAASYAIAAGNTAASLYAHEQAITHYHQALDYDLQANGLSSSARIQLYRSYGRALELAQNYKGALDLYMAQAERGTQLDDGYLRVEGLINAATVRAVPSAFQDLAIAEQLGQDALTLAQAIEQPAAEARALWTLLLTYDNANQEHAAVEVGLRSLQIARQHNLSEQLAFTLNDLSRPLMALKGPLAAREITLEAQTMWREQGNLPMLSDNLNNIAIIDLLLGNTAKARRWAAEALEMNERIGNDWGIGNSQSWLAYVDLEHGRFEQAINRLSTTRETVTANQMLFIEMYATTFLAWVYTSIGDYSRAQELLESIAHLIPTVPDGVASWPLAIRARMAVRSGDLATAQQLVEQAQRLIKDQPLSSFSILFVPLIQVEIAYAQHNYQQVLSTTATISQRLQQNNVYYQLVDVLLYRALAFLALDDLDSAAAISAEALDLAEQSELRRLLPALHYAQSRIAHAQGDQSGSANALAHAQASLAAILSDFSDAQLRQRYASQPLHAAITAGELRDDLLVGY